MIAHRSGNNYEPWHKLSRQKVLDNSDGVMMKKGYCLHMGARNAQAERFCNLLKPLVAQEVPYMLYKFF